MYVSFQAPSLAPLEAELLTLVNAYQPQVIRSHAELLQVQVTKLTPTQIQTLKSQCFALGADCNILPELLEPANFKLLAMDMDSTLITIECIDEIADMLGVKKEVSAITEEAMRGELDFTQSLRRRVALLKGLPVGELAKVYEERLKFSPGARNLIAAAKQAGWTTLLVSGGFTYFTQRVQQELGLDFTHANTLEVHQGLLTGQVTGVVVDGLEKKAQVERICQQLAISPSQAIVIGDGANDLHMMSIAGLSVAYKAKPVVREQANVGLNFNGLDAVLSLFRA